MSGYTHLDGLMIANYCLATALLLTLAALSPVVFKDICEKFQAWRRARLASARAREVLRKVDGLTGECAICMDRLESGVEFPCRHAFHRECVFKWVKSSPSCPQCRADIMYV